MGNDCDVGTVLLLLPSELKLAEVFPELVLLRLKNSTSQCLAVGLASLVEPVEASESGVEILVNET